MAKSFKELGRKAEALIEQGQEADRRIQACQARVASCHSNVAAARMQLDAASETDDEGYPLGDVAYARAQLSMAENQLAASQRALDAAYSVAEGVRQQKKDHVQEIGRHNKVGRSNLEKLRSLRSAAFGDNAAPLSAGMAERLNEAEDSRVALLRSMGIEATPDYVVIGGDGIAAPEWRGGGFAPLDVTGQIQRHQGGSPMGLNGSGGETRFYDDNGVNFRVGNSLTPNITYTINGYTYQSDDAGRIVSVEGTLHLKEREGRLTIRDNLGDIGQGDECGGDDRGHLIGDQFDGSNGLENMVPQEANIRNWR